jgi:hypothetical protein
MIKENILSLSYWLKENYNTVIFLLIAIMSIFVFIIMGLYVWGFICNGLWGMKFPLETILSFTTILIVQSISLAGFAFSCNSKYKYDSSLNSEDRKPAYSNQIVNKVENIVNSTIGGK